MRKTQALINKPVYLSLSVLDLSKTVMYEFWYNYVKPKYDNNAKPFYMDADSVIVYVKAYDLYKDIAEDVETRFDTLSFELDKPLPKVKNKKIIALTIKWISGQITKKIFWLRAQTYRYLKDSRDDD